MKFLFWVNYPFKDKDRHFSQHYLYKSLVNSEPFKPTVLQTMDEVDKQVSCSVPLPLIFTTCLLTNCGPPLTAFVYFLHLVSHLLVPVIPSTQGLQTGPLCRHPPEARWDLAAPESLAFLGGGNSRESSPSLRWLSSLFWVFFT